MYVLFRFLIFICSVFAMFDILEKEILSNKKQKLPTIKIVFLGLDTKNFAWSNK